MNIWSRRAVISQIYQGMQTFLESPQLDEKNMSINRLTNRPCFPSIFDVSTMLKLCWICSVTLWGRQLRIVLKFLPINIIRSNWKTSTHVELPPSDHLGGELLQALALHRTLGRWWIKGNICLEQHEKLRLFSWDCQPEKLKHGISGKSAVVVPLSMNC